MLTQAIEKHPDYDLIVVRGYTPNDPYGEEAPAIEAWYKPENIEQIDLEPFEEAQVSEHCYSCVVYGEQKG